MIMLIICLLPSMVVAGDTDVEAETVTESELESEIRQDIENLHDFFVGWYEGSLPESAYDEEFAARMAEGFTIVMPSGKELDYQTLSTAMRQSFGQKPGFVIEIKNVRLIYSSETTAVASYEEWQRMEHEDAESARGRLSTVIFATDDQLRWLRVHETWLPDGN